MSNTKREPLLSDVDILYPLTADLTGIEYAKQMGRREGHSAARAKDGELIQQLVDALSHSAQLSGKKVSIAEALAAAAAQGFTPTPDTHGN